MTATLHSLSEARAIRALRKIRMPWTYRDDPTLAAWLSREHMAVMSPHPPTLPCEKIPAPVVELPSDCE